MTTLHVTDANTGNIVAIDTENPSGSIYVVDSNTGNIVPVDLSSPSGVINAIDEDTGNIVSLDLGNLTGVITVVDANTGNFFDVDFDNPSGLFYTRDEDTGDLVQIDLSTDTFFKAEGLIIPRWQYWQRIINLLGRQSIVAYWPLWETSGSIATDIINSRNGSYNASIVLNGITSLAGKPAPTFPGTSGVNINVANAAASFPATEGTLMLWAKALNSGIWTDGQAKQLGYFFVNGNNYVAIQQSANNQLRCIYNAGGSFKQLTATSFPTGWFHLAITWSVSNGRVRVYRNGVQFFADLTSIGTWAGSIITALIGGGAVAAQTWKGYESDAILLNRELTAVEIKNIVKYVQWKGLSILGDSIANNIVESWPEVVEHTWQGGSSGLMDHANGGDSIMDNMDAQALAAANDDANVIILAIGANDNNAGDMSALQAKYEENIVKLKASNPHATIYSMNILPVWTDITGTTPVNKANIRTAIAAACVSQGITCWDTFTIPWITAGQTSDGVHPTAAGHATIATQVLARL